jgi:hypothetical protein
MEGRRQWVFETLLQFLLKEARVGGPMMAPTLPPACCPLLLFHIFKNILTNLASDWYLLLEGSPTWGIPAVFILPAEGGECR